MFYVQFNVFAGIKLDVFVKCTNISYLYKIALCHVIDFVCYKWQINIRM